VIHIRTMTAADLALGMRLKCQAGWNQVQSDWQRFLSMQPDGCFVAEWNGMPVGTTVACIFDNVAWLAMVLVDAAARGKGIGGALIRHALTFVERAGVRTVRLDATPLGRPLYEKFGFMQDYELSRYEGVLRTPAESYPSRTAALVRTAQSTEYLQLFALDQAVVGADRRKFLSRLFDDNPDDVRVVCGDGDLEGYLAVRAGSEALQIGPCMATERAGAALLTDAARRFAGRRVMIDVPHDNAPAVRAVQAMRLEAARSFTRMHRGPRRCDDPTRLWASSGPELG
jgi:GNAT superfamily N-acetyltransferase